MSPPHLPPPGQWKLHGLTCYQFFDIRHSWQKASELCKRYGSNLVSVASFRQNNFTGELAQQQLQTSNPEDAYWLGYQTQNELQTNLLASASGSQISQYYGHWAQRSSLTQEMDYAWKHFCPKTLEGSSGLLRDARRFCHSCAKSR